MKHFLLSAGIFVFLYSIVTPVRGDDKAEARRHFKEGTALLQSGDVGRATLEFEISVSYYANQNNLYNLANCYRALGRDVKAHQIFERILAEEDFSLRRKMRKDIARQIEEIESITGRLTILVKPDGAVITVDGEERGKAPLDEPLLIKAGKHEVEVISAPFQSVSKKVVIVPETDESIEINLEELNVELKVTSNVNGTEVTVDGEPRGIIPLKQPIFLKEGTHIVTVSKQGYHAQEKEITIAHGLDQTVAFKLVPIVTTKPATIQAKVPKKKPYWRHPYFVSSVSATVVSAGLSLGFWIAGGRNAADYRDKVDVLNESWDEEIAKNARSENSTAKKLNKAAVGTTIATGVFTAMLVSVVVMKPGEKEARPVALSPLPSGVQLLF